MTCIYSDCTNKTKIIMVDLNGPRDKLEYEQANTANVYLVI